MKPTVKSVLEAMREFTEIGQPQFLKKYESGTPKTRFLRHEGTVYPLRALWLASQSSEDQERFYYRDAKRGFIKLGFPDVFTTSSSSTTDAEEIRLDQIAAEGARMLKEITFLRRNCKIVAEVKRTREPICEACDFDFEEFYGDIGSEYIECHHTRPLYERNGKDEITNLDELALLCSNCHRMIHRQNPCLTLAQLRRRIMGHRR